MKFLFKCQIWNMFENFHFFVDWAELGGNSKYLNDLKSLSTKHNFVIASHPLSDIDPSWSFFFSFRFSFHANDSFPTGVAKSGRPSVCCYSSQQTTQPRWVRRPDELLAISASSGAFSPTQHYQDLFCMSAPALSTR